MRCSSTSTTLAFLLLLLLVNALVGSGVDFGPLECLRTPSSPSIKFLATLNATVNELPRVAEAVAGYSSLNSDFHVSNAVSDCVDLLDTTSEVLDWSLSATQNCTGHRTGSGDLNNDLRTWLSAALTNMDTCIDGFQGAKTGTKIKQSVSDHIDRVKPMLVQLLDSVSTSCTGKSSRLGSLEAIRAVPANGVAVNVTVAADGSGDFRTVGEAVKAAPDKSKKRFVIYVKRGVYKENVEVKKKKWNIMMIGDGIDVTVITGDRCVRDGWTTFRSATFAVSGRGFIARDISFENTAGPSKGQAVALRSDSDLSVFHRCSFSGFQDTLYAHSMRHFFRECRVSGTVDFIFGNAAAVFQSCHITARRRPDGPQTTVTAQGRRYANETTGFTLQFCNVTADGAAGSEREAFLGRPWKRYSRTVVMQSYLGDAISSKGWLEWEEGYEDTLFYGEYMNSGPGAGLGGRVKWAGFRVISGPKEAMDYTVARFIEGNSWLPATGVEYVSGLGYRQ